MLSHISMFFGHSIFLFLLSARWPIPGLQHLSIEKCQSFSFDTSTCSSNLLMLSELMSTPWRWSCFITSKDVQQLVRNSQADCLEFSVGVVTDSTVRGHSARRDHRGKERGCRGEKLFKIHQMCLKDISFLELFFYKDYVALDVFYCNALANLK